MTAFKHNSTRTTAGELLLIGAGLACTGALAVVNAAERARKKRRWFDGSVVLVTGSSRGLGLAMAEEFGRRGARLVLTSRSSNDLDRARELLLHRRAVARPEDILVLPCDLRDEEGARKMVDDATAHFGRIDVVVNNAGIITVGPVESQTVENFRDVMNSNFFSAVHTTMAVLPQMLARRSGAIVNITSIGGKVAVPHMLPYTASKFAAVGLSQGLTAELRSKGIRVTTVCPGLMRTGSHLNALFAGDQAREYRWFSLSAALPGISASARTAARKIVRAAARGAREISITPQAAIVARTANLFPRLTSISMQVVNAVLPSPASEPGAVSRGADVRSREIGPAVVLGNAAARRYNQTRP